MRTTQIVASWTCDRCHVATQALDDQTPDHWLRLNNLDLCGNCREDFEGWWRQTAHSDGEV